MQKPSLPRSTTVAQTRSRSFTYPIPMASSLNFSSPSSSPGGITFAIPVLQGHAGTQAGFQGAWNLELPLTGR